MEDTGELVHVMHSDLHSGEINGYDQENAESSLDFGQGKRRGLVPNFSQLDAEGDDIESDLDLGSSRVSPGKRSANMGIVRRKGVSKTKGSPYRHSSSHEDEFGSLSLSQQGGVAQLQRRNSEQEKMKYSVSMLRAYGDTHWTNTTLG